MDPVTVSEVVSKIEQASKVLLLTHLNPDADTLGSASAIYDILWRKQKKVYLFNASQEISHNLTKIAYVDKLQHTLPKQYDLALSFDCGSLERLGVESVDSELINIDHHVSNDHYGTINVLQTACVSATEVVYRLFKAAGWKISEKAAQSLYTGIVSDSLSFGSDRVTPELFETASELVRLGADPELSRDMLYEQHSLARMRLASKMMDTLSLHMDGRLAYIYADEAMFEATGAQHTDTEEALRMVMAMGVVQIALVLRSEKPGIVKGSLRSKGIVDVNKVASHFNGGGHKRASGFQSRESMESIKAKIIEIIKKEIA